MEYSHKTCKISLANLGLLNQVDDGLDGLGGSDYIRILIGNKKGARDPLLEIMFSFPMHFQLYDAMAVSR